MLGLVAFFGRANINSAQATDRDGKCKSGCACVWVVYSTLVNHDENIIYYNGLHSLCFKHVDTHTHSSMLAHHGRMHMYAADDMMAFYMCIFRNYEVYCFETPPFQSILLACLGCGVVVDDVVGAAA